MAPTRVTDTDEGSSTATGSSANRSGSGDGRDGSGNTDGHDPDERGKDAHDRKDVHDRKDARADGGKRPETQQLRHERKQRVLTQGQASVVSSIADAVVIKDGDVFLVCRRDGSVPAGVHHGYGIYYHDCRYLDRYELGLADATGIELASSDAEGYAATLELSNPDIGTARHELVAKEHVGITWRRVLDGERLSLHDALGFENFGR